MCVCDNLLKKRERKKKIRLTGIKTFCIYRKCVHCYYTQQELDEYRQQPRIKQHYTDFLDVINVSQKVIFRLSSGLQTKTGASRQL